MKDEKKYGKNWKRWREFYIKRAGGKCQECGHIPDPNKKYDYLIPHHIDGDKTNHHPSNIKVLCMKCHIRKSHRDWLASKKFRRLQVKYARQKERLANL